jgi:hypothetical protein
VVEHLPHHSKVEGLNPAAWRKERKGTKEMFWKITKMPISQHQPLKLERK